MKEETYGRALGLVNDEDRTVFGLGEPLVLCVKNDDCDDLEKHKVYRVTVDPKAEKDGYLRVIDESGGDFFYPAFYFVRVELLHEAEQAIAAAG